VQLYSTAISISWISYSTVLAGVVMVTTSPTLWPMSAFAHGRLHRDLAFFQVGLFLAHQGCTS